MIFKPQRVLWPTDFSDMGRQGGAYARAVAETYNAALHVIHICQPPFVSALDMPMAGTVAVGAPPSMVLRPTQARLDEVVARDFSGMKEVKSDVLIGTPWSEICKYAQANQIDLIVIGTHGYTGLKRVLIGSTAERVVQYAECPVLTVKVV